MMRRAASAALSRSAEDARKWSARVGGDIPSAFCEFPGMFGCHFKLPARMGRHHLNEVLYRSRLESILSILKAGIEVFLSRAYERQLELPHAVEPIHRARLRSICCLPGAFSQFANRLRCPPLCSTLLHYRSLSFEKCARTNNPDPIRLMRASYVGAN